MHNNIVAHNNTIVPFQKPDDKNDEDFSLAELTWLSPATICDLRKSGLSTKTVLLMNLREIWPADRKVIPWGDTGAMGYIIPYYGLTPGPILDRGVYGEADEQEFFRVRFHEPRPEGVPKYVQPVDSGVHVFLPRSPNSKLTDPKTTLLIVEGEKKAAALAQAGYAAVGIGGVDSFTRGRFRGREDNVKRKQGGWLTWDLKSGASVADVLCAPEFALLVLEGRKVVLLFDSDLTEEESPNTPIKKSVQEAAFRGSQLLESLGAIVLQGFFPAPHKAGEKVGADDYLLWPGANLDRIITEARPILPPNMKKYVMKALDSKPGRTGKIKVVETIIKHLDQEGVRYRDAESESLYYYHDKNSYQLDTMDWGKEKSFRLGPFPARLNRDYTLGESDHDTILRLVQLFIAGSRKVKTEKLFHNAGEALYLQTNDNDIFKIDREGVHASHNGVDGVLFRGGIAEPVEGLLPEHYQGPPKREWRGVVDQLSLTDQPHLTVEESRALLEVLTYLMPWFWDWRGLELPLITFTGEQGSGKSYYWYVVMGVQLGLHPGRNAIAGTPTNIAELRAMTRDSIGLLVLDNFRPESVKTWRNQFEEDLSRFITLKNQTFRPLYGDVVVRAETKACCVISSVKPPFHAADLIERSLPIMFKKIDFQGREVMPDWHHGILLKEPGRAALYGDLMRGAQGFLRVAYEQRDVVLPQRTRLAGFDRAMLYMAEALDATGELREQIVRIIAKLPQVIQDSQVESDWALHMLREFAEWHVDQLRNQPAGTERPQKAMFPLSDITKYVGSKGKRRFPFDNSHLLKTFIEQTPETIYALTGIRWVHKNAAQPFYEVDQEVIDRLNDPPIT